MYLRRIVSQIDNSLPETPAIRPGGSLLMMVGLPGTGKSSVVKSLQALIPYVVISTDAVRSQMRRQPTYTASEMMLVYEASYSLIELRLEREQRVVFDASNYLAARREYVAQLATRCGAPVATCYVQADEETIRQRLKFRSNQGRQHGDLSDADWPVYKWMVETQEPVAGPHLILDTTTTPVDLLVHKLHSYWLDIEASAAFNPDLQSPSWADRLGRHR